MTVLITPQRPVRLAYLKVTSDQRVLAATVPTADRCRTTSSASTWACCSTLRRRTACRSRSNYQGDGKVTLRVLDGSDGLTGLPGLHAPAGRGRGPRLAHLGAGRRGEDVHGLKRLSLLTVGGLKRLPLPTVGGLKRLSLPTVGGTLQPMRTTLVRQLTPDDWRTLREVRLAALADAPDAFMMTYADAVGLDEQEWRIRTTRSDMFAAFVGGEPVGLVGLLAPPPRSAELMGARQALAPKTTH